MSVAHGEQVRVLEEHGHEGERGLNWWGMVFFIASEALIFANLIAAFLYLEVRDAGHAWKLPGSGEFPPPVLFPAGVNTAILISSSIFVHIAGTGLRKDNRRQFLIGLSLTILFGAIFLAGQIYEYADFIGKGFAISTGTFGSSFYMLTGFHGLHVLIGAIFLLVCLIRGVRGDFTSKKHFAFQAAEMYWHFVDAVWIFVFSVVYLLPLFR